MLEIKSYNGKYFIEIEVDKKVIREYGLETVIRNSYLVNHPKFEHSWQSFEGKGSIFCQFTLPPYNKKYGKAYYATFISHFSAISDEIEKRHFGNLLFFSYTYFLSHNEKYKDFLTQSALRKNGKLLYDLIKIAIPLLNPKNIYNAFSKYPYFIEKENEEEKIEKASRGDNSEVSEDQKEANKIILSYLSLITHKDYENFIESRTIDLDKLPKELWTELNRRILKDQHISILIQRENIDEGLKEKHLTISSDVILNFQIKSDKSNKYLLAKGEDLQNRRLMQVIVQQLFDEQKQHNTPFYNALLSHDYIISKDFEELKNTSGGYLNKEQHAFNLYKVQLALEKYLHEENILKRGSNAEWLRQNYIYQYYILLGILRPFIEDGFSGYKNIKELNSAVSASQIVVEKKHNYGKENRQSMFHKLSNYESIKPKKG